ncbi:MAG TPA: sigma-70 family RNA polymerase sigma factor [Planctomycetota bacterium]|nr:sigma-70 family RNA polymerase sigma factor [Planctomycetota bacterium]
MTERTVEDLYDRFRRLGDMAALGTVFDELAPQLQRIARHLAHDRAEADDLVQGTFLAAIQRRDAFDPTRKLAPWLTGILLKQASLARRARGRAVDPVRLDPRASESPADTVGARELSDALAVALGKLSETDREVLIPLLLDGRRAVEIARELGRRPDTVHMSIQRGLRRLRRLLPASLAFAGLLGTARARGLGAVREIVMGQARVQLGIAGGSGGAALAASTGVAMVTKQAAAAVAVIVVCVGLAGYLLSTGGLGGESTAAKTDVAVIETPAVDRAADEPAVAAAERSEGSSQRLAAPSSAPQGPARFELELLRGDRHPAAAALVAFVDAAGVLKSATADEHGVCAFTAGRGGAEVYVRDEASLPYHARIEVAGEARQTLELPLGSELSGRLVMVSGEPPPSVEVQLSSDSAPEGFASADLAIFKALELIRYESKDIKARARPAADGSFLFRGLPERWSGALILPTELVFVVDGKPTRSSQQVFASAARGLELPIAYRERIIGRLLDVTTRQPIANAEFNCSIQWSDGGSMVAALRTGADGRFTYALDGDTDAVGIAFGTFSIRGGARATALREPKWEGPCEPFDAGDVECSFPPARPIEFHAVDSQGRSVPGARAGIRDLGTAVADTEGVGRFSFVPFDAEQMRVVAAGHRIATIPLDKDTHSPLVVVLAPANRLTLALPPEAVGRKDLHACLVSRALLFGGKTRMYDSNLHGDVVGQCWTADGDQGTKERSVRFAFSEDGRIEVEDVLSDVPFRVQLRGSAGQIRSTVSDLICEIAIDSLGPVEQRRIDLAIDPAIANSLRVLRGHVIDEQGQSIQGAGVSHCFACNMSFMHSDFEGNFHVDLVDESPTDLEVSKRGYVPFRVRGFVPGSDNTLEARLVRGHDLRIDLVDEHDRPIEAAKLKAEIDGFGPASKIEKGASGVFTLCDMPPGLVRITIEVAGKTYVRLQDALAGAARILLPEHGRLEITLDFPQTADGSEYYRLVLSALTPEGASQTASTPWPYRVKQHVIESVLPGEYTLCLEAGTLNSDRTDYIYAPLHPAVHLTITGGRTIKVELPPSDAR